MPSEAKGEPSRGGAGVHLGPQEDEDGQGSLMEGPKVLSLFHAVDTSGGIDNHYLLLVSLISRKYFRLRINNILRDMNRARAMGNGNELTRRRVIYHQ